MTRDFKKTFFTCLLTVLLIISNLIGLKLTNFLDLTISVDFITYPFTFLCTLLLLNTGGKKTAYQGILISAVIQIFITISYTIAIKLGNQTIIPDLSLYVNELFKVDELKILASIIAFLVSHYVLIYIYENLRSYGKELYGVVIGLLGALFLNSTIYLVITLNGYEPIFIINMLLSNIIISIIMIVVITIMFYLLKEKSQVPVEINTINVNVIKQLDDDKAITDIINLNKKPRNKSVKPKTNSKNTKNNTKSNKKTNTKINKTNNYQKSAPKSKSKVNKSKKDVKSVDL